MSREQAKRGYPVRVRGVITFVWPNAGFFLQDGTRSIDVRLAPTVAAATNLVVPKIGDYWEVRGRTFAEFAPDIMATQAMRLGPGTLPDVVHPNLEQLVDGSLDTQYIEVQGVALSAETNALSLLTSSGPVRVQLPEYTWATLKQYEGALVRVRGCLIPGRDTSTQQVKLGEFELRNASIAVDEPAPKNPFALPLKTASSLLLFESHISPIQRTKLRGVVLRQWQGICFLMDGSNGVRLMLKSPAPLKRGDRVEMVGFPDLSGPSPLLRDGLVQRLGRASLPKPVRLASGNLLSDRFDSTRVQIVATLASQRAGQSDQVLEMRSGPRMWMARLPVHAGRLPPLAPGSELQLTGVYVGHGGDRATGRGIDSFELLLNSPASIVILRKPSWWTTAHSLAVAGTLSAVLLLAFIWIWALRRRVEERTAALKQEIEDHERTELELQEKTKMLTREIEERVRMEAEIERGHKQLLITSRLAGMAEVATSVLHNVGNVMTNVNVLSGSIVQLIRNSKISSVARLGKLLGVHRTDVPHFFTEDERGRKMPEYVQRLGSHLQQEQTTLLEKVRALDRNIDHINEIVAMQQTYAKVSGIWESVPPEEVIEDALRMEGESFHRHGIEIVRRFDKIPAVIMDRHKILQILFNLLENAKHACLQTNPVRKQVIVTLRQTGPEFIQMIVADNGMGIPPENLKRIFGQGFSTRKDGHGFGLHSSVLTAQDMGGGLTAHSDGTGKGATFTLEIPLAPRGVAPKSRGVEAAAEIVP